MEFFIIYFEGSIYIVPFILCEKRNIVLSLCLDGKSKSSGSRFLCVCFSSILFCVRKDRQYFSWSLSLSFPENIRGILLLLPNKLPILRRDYNGRREKRKE